LLIFLAARHYDRCHVPTREQTTAGRWQRRDLPATGGERLGCGQGKIAGKHRSQLWTGGCTEVVERLRRLAKSILRRCSPEEIVATGGDWHLICAWPYGDLYVLETVWKQLGIDAIVRQQAQARHLCFDVERALFALVANRACAPASKLYCHEQWLKEDAHMDGTQGLQLHQLYQQFSFRNLVADSGLRKSWFFI
jgi:hypothetical protein